MLRKNGSYSFLFTRTKKDKIIIRRVDFSKKIAQTLTLSVTLFLGISLLGAFAVYKNGANLEAASASQEGSIVSNSKIRRGAERKQIDYSRHHSSEEFTNNSGGPADYQLSTANSSTEAKEIESRLASIEAKSDPAFLPSIWAHLGKVNNEFGFRRNPFGGRSYEFHSGMDIDGESGDMIVAPANGIISFSAWKGGYGRLVEINHGNGLITRFGHLSKLLVKEGDSIQRGQVIAHVGSTGRSTGPHLHYELRLGKKAINPRRFLPPEPRVIRK